jgi:hypothetical protein
MSKERFSIASMCSGRVVECACLVATFSAQKNTEKVGPESVGKGGSAESVGTGGSAEKVGFLNTITQCCRSERCVHGAFHAIRV